MDVSVKDDVKYIKYGLRIYRENGRTTDSKNKCYFGWGEGFDKEVCVHDPKLRKPGEFSKPVEHYEIITSYPIDSKRFNEIESYFPVINIYIFYLNLNLFTLIYSLKLKIISSMQFQIKTTKEK